MSSTTLAGALFGAVMLLLGATSDAMSFSLRPRPPAARAHVVASSDQVPSPASGDRR